MLIPGRVFGRAGNEPDILAPWQFPAAGEQYAPRTQVRAPVMLVTLYLPV